MRNMLKHVTGVDAYLIASLFIFLAFFVVMAIWLTLLSKNKVDYIKNIPLNDSENDSFSISKTLSVLGIISIFSIPNLYAQSIGTGSSENVLFEMLTYVAITSVLALALAALLVALQLFAIIYKHVAPEDEKDLTLFQLFLGLKPISKEKDLFLPESYDGIKELDNPVPVWFNVLFGATITFGVFYMLVYHVWNIGDFQETEYTKEVQYAAVQKDAYLKQIASLIDEKNVAQTKDKKALAEGEKIFQANCASCHGKKMEGGIGPNLTDEYWLHEGDINAVFLSIKKGFPTKGMIAWENKLNPLQIQNIASYVLTMQGTNPPNAKEPQGKKSEKKAEKKGKIINK